MKELIERIEGAEGESYVLFWGAYRAIFPSLRSRDHSVEECDQSDLRAYRFGQMIYAEAWLSAAEMLVPDGFMWEIGCYTDADGFSAGNFARVDTYCGGDGPRFEWGTQAATPALALCAAAIKARHAETGEGR